MATAMSTVVMTATPMLRSTTIMPATTDMDLPTSDSAAAGTIIIIIPAMVSISLIVAADAMQCVTITGAIGRGNGPNMAGIAPEAVILRPNSERIDETAGMIVVTAPAINGAVIIATK